MTLALCDTLRACERLNIDSIRIRHNAVGCWLPDRVAWLYNEMLEATKQHYADTGKFLFKYDLTTRFDGRGGDTFQPQRYRCWRTVLDKALRRYLAFKEQRYPLWLSSFQDAEPLALDSVAPTQERLPCCTRMASTSWSRCKLGLLPQNQAASPDRGHASKLPSGVACRWHWYALIVCEPAGARAGKHHAKTSGACPHPDIGLDVGLKVFLADSTGQTVANPRYYRRSQEALRRKQRNSADARRGAADDGKPPAIVRRRI